MTRGHRRLAGTSCPLPAARGAAARRGSLPIGAPVLWLFPEAVNPPWVPAPSPGRRPPASRTKSAAQIYQERDAWPWNRRRPQGKNPAPA